MKKRKKGQNDREFRATFIKKRAWGWGRLKRRLLSKLKGE